MIPKAPQSESVSRRLSGLDYDICIYYYKQMCNLKLIVLSYISLRKFYKSLHKMVDQRRLIPTEIKPNNKIYNFCSLKSSYNLVYLLLSI